MARIHNVSDNESLDELLSSGIDINLCDENRETLLHHCIKKDNYPLAEYCKEKGINLLLKNQDGLSPYTLALKLGKIKFLHLYLEEEGMSYDYSKYAHLLVVACTSQDLILLKHLHQYGADINYCDEKGKSLLFYGKEDSIQKYLIDNITTLEHFSTYLTTYSYKENPELCTILLKKSGNINSPMLYDKTPCTMLDIAYIKNDDKKILSLQKEGAHASCLKESYLTYAIRNKNQKMITLFMKQKMDYDITTLTPYSDDIEFIKYFTKECHNINDLQIHGIPILDYYIKEGETPLVWHLLDCEYILTDSSVQKIIHTNQLPLLFELGEKGLISDHSQVICDECITYKDIPSLKKMIEEQWVFLHEKMMNLGYALENNKVEMLDLLLQHKKIDPNAEVEIDGYSYTPLAYALKNNKVEMLELLLQHKNPNDAVMIDGYGYTYTPLGYALEKDNVEVIKLLLEHKKVDPNAEVKINGYGYTYTPLAYALEKDNVEVIKLLLEHEADPNAEVTINGSHYTPLGYALQRGNVAMVELLLEHEEVDPNTEVTIDGSHYTPLAYAERYRRDDEIIELLKKAGAK